MTESDAAGRLERALEKVQRISRDGSELAEEVLERVADDEPLKEDEARRLLDKAIRALRADAERAGDEETVARIDDQTAEIRDELLASDAVVDDRTVELEGEGKIQPRPVHPKPIFHERAVDLMAGFVPLDAIQLWDGNERLAVHLEQFERTHGRKPGPRELLDIMSSRMELPGLEDEDDQFEIVGLARSIAAGGIRQPPIIGRDGTLYDGNRRIAAAHLIRSSDEFDSDHKRRVAKVWVWQLPETATDDDVERVLMALNFEDDLKEPWPEYVKAQKVAEEWRAIHDAEDPPPGNRRAAQLKRELSQRFALGPDTTHVNRYIKMVERSKEFETYLIEERGEDTSAVKHAAARYFQYFDELNKGARPGGVAWTLGRDDVLRGLVFDLLYEGKFRNWRQVRKLKHVADHEEVVEQLRDARDLPRKEARQKVDIALALGETHSTESRTLGANTRIKAFADWLHNLPMGAFRDGHVRPENVERLLVALTDARQQAVAVLGEERVRELTE